jgi:hypothetical protein
MQTSNGRVTSRLRRGSLCLALALIAPTAFGGIVIGTVKNAAGVGVVGVTVNIPGAGLSTTTVAGGSFTFASVPNGTYSFDVNPGVGSPLYAPSQLFNVSVGAALLNLGTVTVQTGVVLTGTVVADGGGGPLAACDTDVFVASTGVKLYTPSDNTDAAGVFSVVVPAGVYVVSADSPVGLTFVTAQVGPVTVAAPGPVVVPTISLQQGFLFSLTTKDSGGAAINDVNLDVEDQFTGVRLNTPNDLTDGSGFVQVVVPAGLYRVSLKPKLGDPFVAVQIENVGVFGALAIGDVFLETGFEITGVVRNAAAQPLPGMDVDVDNVLGPRRVFTPYDTTDAAGAWYAVVPAGTYVVGAHAAPGSTLVAVDSPPVAVGADATFPPLTLAAGFLLSGAATNPSSAPEAHCFVRVVNATTGAVVPNPYNETASDGTFSIAVPAGTYDVTLTPFHASLAGRKTFSGVAVAGPTFLNAPLDLVVVATYMVPSLGQTVELPNGSPVFVDAAFYAARPFVNTPLFDIVATFVDPAGVETSLFPPVAFVMPPGFLFVAPGVPLVPPTLPAGQLGFPARIRVKCVEVGTGVELDRDEFVVTFF